MDRIAGRLVYLITGDNSSLRNSAQDSQKQMTGLANTAKTTGSMIKRYLGAGAMILAGKEMVSLSSATQELSNKFNVVFNGAIQSTNIWLDEYTEAVGRGDLATREYLTSLQDIRTGFGDSVPEASKFSQAVVGVTNDLSSFSNVGFEETSAAIQSGLSGQFIALRRLGVGLNVAIIDQGEYAQSIGKTWAEMSNLERQEAILSGIMSQSANALGQNVSNWRDYNYQLGDAARTSKSFANQSKALGQEVKDMAAGFGDELMPSASEFIGLSRDLVGSLDDMDPAIKRVTIAVVALSASFMAGGWVAAAGLAVGALALKIRDSRDRTDELKSVTDDLVTISGEYQSVVQELTEDINSLSEVEKGLLEARKTLLTLELEKALADYSKEYEKFNNQVERESAANEELEARRAALLLIQNDANAAEERFMELHQKRFETFNLTNKEADEYNTLLTFLGKNERALSREIEKVNESFVDQSSKLSALEIAGKESILQFAKAYKDGALDIEIYKDLNSELYDEIIRVASGLSKSTVEVEDNGDAAGEAAKSWREYLQEILKLGDAKSITWESGREAAEKYLEAFERGLTADQDIHEALNGNLDEWTPLPLLQQKASAVRTVLSEMLSIDPSEIDEAFIASDRTVQILLDSLKETEEQIKEITAAQEALKESKKKELQEAQAREKAEKKSLQVIEEYTEKAADLGRTAEERLIAERDLAVKRAEADGLSAEAVEAIIDYYDELIEKMDEVDESKESVSWDQWASSAFKAVSDITQAFSKLHEVMTEKRLEALDAQMEAELSALGLLDEEERNRYTKDRQEASQKLQNIQSDARKETDLEKKNELLKAAAEQAVELDKLVQQEAREEKKLAIEEKYERQRARLEYEAAMQSWQLKKVDAIAGGAMAVLSALQTQPWYLGLAMSVIAGAVSGIEIATVNASKPNPPSFAVGAWDIPEDMNANIHKGEMILPEPFADSLRSMVSSGGSVGGVSIEIYTTDQVETEEQLGESGEIEKIRVFVGKTWRELYHQGRFDSDLVGRHGIRKVGRS